MSVQSSEITSNEAVVKANILASDLIGAGADVGSGADVATQLALSTYEGLRGGGLSDTDIMAFAGELLALVAAGVRATPDAE